MNIKTINAAGNKTCRINLYVLLIIRHIHRFTIDNQAKSVLKTKRIVGTVLKFGQPAKNYDIFDLNNSIPVEPLILATT